MNFDEIKLKYENLQTIPPTEVTLSFIDEMLDNSEVPSGNRYEFANLIFELMSALTDNYARITDEQSVKIISWIEKNWCEDDISYTDLQVSIIANTEESLAKNFIESKISTAKNSQVREMLEEVKDELS